MELRAVVILVAACGPGTSAPCTLSPGDLVITEVFADFQAQPGGAGSDPGREWFEIYNHAGRALELEGLTLTRSRPDGTMAKSHRMSEIMIASGAYLTLGDTSPELAPAYVDYGYGSDLGDLYNTDGGKLALACGATEIDAATYDTVKVGHSRELTAAQPPDAKLNDDPASWCEGDATEFEAGNFGTPGAANDCVPIAAGGCLDGGVSRPVVSPGAGDLVITEVMPSPSKVADTFGEWFEAKALKAVDLNGVGLDRAGDSADQNLIASPACIHVAAGDYVVFGRSQTGNGGLPSVTATFTFALVAAGDVRILAGPTVVDAITWTHSTSGVALQLDPTLTDAISNDDEANFCNATQPYGLGDLGTPGAPNDHCALVPPAGMCDDAGTIRAITAPAAGQLVISEIMPNPKLEPAQEWFEVTNIGTNAFDVNELGLDRAGDTRAPDVIHAADCKSLAPGAFALFARSADPASNGMLPPVDATFGFSMVNSAGDVRVLSGTTVLDAVTWATSTDGVSSQVAPGHLTTTDNDSAASFCAATTPYGDATNKGTPKAANSCP